MRPRFTTEIKARVTDQTRVALESIAAEREIPVSAVMREALRWYVLEQTPHYTPPTPTPEEK